MGGNSRSCGQTGARFGDRIDGGGVGGGEEGGRFRDDGILSPRSSSTSRGWSGPGVEPLYCKVADLRADVIMPLTLTCFLISRKRN